MISRLAASVLVFGVALLPPLPSLARQSASAPRGRPLTVRQVRTLCARSGGIHLGVWVIGHYQRGPITDGPFQFEGLLFDSSKAKLPPGTVPSTPAQRHGVRAAIMNTMTMTRAGYAAVSRIHPRNLIQVHGAIVCAQGHASVNADRAKVATRSGQ